MRLRWPRRRRRPDHVPRVGLEIRVDRDRVAPGETVQGSVLAGDDGSDGEVLVALTLRERSTEYESVASTIPADAGGAIAARATREFAIELPEGALPSVRATHGGLTWTVDATDDSGADPAASVPIEVVVGAPVS
jgi:hypothetical protein